MDTIKLAPGVTLREGDLVKSVPPIKVSLVYKDDSSDAQLSVLNQIIANVQPLQEPKDRKSVAIQK
jgi:hypothetical protein